jgi:hypothetical protein
MPKPNMHKLYDGKGKTREIPRVVDESDRRAFAQLASQQPTTKATKKAFGPNVKAPTVFGKKASGSTNVPAGTFNPVDLDSTLGAP